MCDSMLLRKALRLHQLRDVLQKQILEGKRLSLTVPPFLFFSRVAAGAEPPPRHESFAAPCPCRKCSSGPHAGPV
jgi:hypothetical protein